MVEDPFAVIADHCIETRRPWLAKEVAYFRGQPDLAHAVAAAASCKQSDGKHHSHQNRITRAARDGARRVLFSELPTMEATESFAELHDIVEESAGRVYGIGELTVYDFAVWIGWYLGLEPTVVYLHRGTRVGARELGLNVSRRTIPVAELPVGLHRLTPGELEDVLCIYKAALADAHRGRMPDLTPFGPACGPATAVSLHC